MRRLAEVVLAVILAAIVCLRPAQASEVRIAVFGLFAPSELRLQPADSQILRLVAASGAIRLEGSEAAVCVVTPGATADEVECRLGQQHLRGQAVELSGEGPAAVFQLSVPGKIERRFQGHLRITPAGGALQAVVTMDLETAVSSIVAAESVPGAALEALKAQAVAARSYLLAGARHDNFDFCDTTHCQYLRAALRPDHPASVATAMTRGLVLTYQGAVVRALYSRSCGGTTRSLHEAGMDAVVYPFYSVQCEACSRNPETWRQQFTEDVISKVLESPTEAARLEVARRAGWSRLPSTRFRSETAGDSVTLHGTGIGHGIGLCQRGAAALASDGASFDAILSHYFPNTTLTARAHR